MTYDPMPVEENGSSVSVVLKPLLVHITEYMRAAAALILLLDPQTEMYQIIATTEENDTGLGSVVRPDEDMVSRVAVTHQPLIVNNYGEWSGRSVEVEAYDVFYDALLCVPLLCQGRYLGGLVVSEQSQVRKFTQEDIPRLEVFSQVIASMLAQCTPREVQPDFEAQLRLEVDEEIRELRAARQKMAEDADELRKILANTVIIREEERSRIAADLHDGLNQLIVGVIYEIQVAEQRLNSGRLKEADQSLETAKELLRKIEADNRVLISGLRPLTLTSHGLVPTFKQFLNLFAKRYDLAFDFQVQGTPLRLQNEIEIAVFRIMQEALQNAMEHAHAQLVHVRLDFSPDQLLLIVEDDGKGFDPQLPYPAERDHLGILNMHGQALSIGARLEIRSARGEGARLMLYVPLLANPDDQLGRFEQLHSIRTAYTQAFHTEED